MVLYLFTLVTE